MSQPNRSITVLENSHLAELKISAIPNDLADRYFCSISHEIGSEWLQFGSVDCKGWMTVPDIGTPQIKLDNPRLSSDGKRIKYETQQGDTIGFSGVTVPNPSVTWITEGFKKAVSIRANYPEAADALSLHGVTRWNIPGTKQIKPELLQAIRTNLVIIGFDTDALYKRQVYNQVVAIANALKAEGKDVVVASWSLDRKGIDDFYHACNIGDIPGNQFALISLEEYANRRAEVAVSESHTKDNSDVFGGLGYVPKFDKTIFEGHVEDHLEKILYQIFPVTVIHDRKRWVYHNLEWHELDPLIQPTLQQAAKGLLTCDGKPYRCKPRELKDAIELVRGRAQISPIYRTPKESRVWGIDYLVYQNGVLYLEDKLFVFNEDWGDNPPFFKHRLDLDYTPKVECPELFRQFIESSYGSDKIEVIRALLATIADPTAPYRYAFALIGHSGSGKSTLLDLIAAFWGRQASNQSSDLSGLSSPSKRYQRLLGKRVYIVGDVQNKLDSIGDFCDAVSNSPMSYRRLHSSDVVEERPNCRFVLASTSPIQVPALNAGWNRRLKIIQTKNRVEKLPVHDLNSALLAILDQIFGWASTMPAEERDRVLAAYTDTEAAIEQSRVNDPVGQFLGDTLAPTDDRKKTSETITSIAGLYEIYKRWASLNSFSHLLNYQVFKAAVRQKLPDSYLPAGNHRVSGKQKWLKESIGYHTGANPDLTEALLNPILISSLNLESFGRISTRVYEDD